MAIPAASVGKTLETIRSSARRRFLFASAFLSLGAFFLAVAQGFLEVLVPVGLLSGIIVGLLLLVLGLGAGAYAAVLLSQAFPLSEPGLSARTALLASLAVALPVSAGVTAVYLLLGLPEFPAAGPLALVLLPAFPLFWGPALSIAAIGLVFAARELGSERMAVLAAIGCGAVIAMSLSAGGGALLQPVGALQSPRLMGDLLLVAVGFLAIALAFHLDSWAARSRGASPLR